MAKFNSIRKFHLPPKNVDELSLCGQKKFKGKTTGLLLTKPEIEFLQINEAWQCKKCLRIYQSKK